MDEKQRRELDNELRQDLKRQIGSEAYLVIDGLLDKFGQDIKKVNEQAASEAAE